MKTNNICGHCKWIKSVNGSWQCDNPASRRYREDVAYFYSPCEYCEDLHQEKTKTVSEDIDQIGKDVVFARKEVGYEDGKNVISVIINAISVRINMPRGTVKALMACFVILLMVAVLYGISLLPSDKAEDRTAESETVQTEEKAEDTSDKSTDTSDDSSSDVVSLKDYVNISSHYYYHLPDNVEDIWAPQEMYAENEMLCDFMHNGNLYTIRSYVLDWRDADLEDIVEDELNQFEVMNILDEEYVDGRYGKILRIRFETDDEDGSPIMGTGYYWYESDPKICCLEVATDAWRDDGPEEDIMKSIYRVSTGTTNPYAVEDPRNTLDEQRKQEALDSLVEDQMRDQNEIQQDEHGFPL